MDYKYIEQLLSRYWAAETSEAEERILRQFFSQPDVPPQLAAYRDLFVYEAEQESVGLGRDFDERVARLAQEGKSRVVRARRPSLGRRLRPLLHAAAVVAICVVVGDAAQRAFRSNGSQPVWDYNLNSYTDSYDNPQEALETVGGSLRQLHTLLAPEGEVRPDSLARTKTPNAPLP